MRRRAATEGTFDLLATELFAVACVAVALAIPVPTHAKLAGLNVTERFVETAPGETVDRGELMATRSP